jgi:hypothetical protein
MVQRTVKELWPTQTAKEIHRRLAEIHVAKLTPQNKNTLLPLIVRHYEDSGDVPGLMEYLEKFGVHCAEQMLVADGMPCFEKLRALVVSEGLENDSRFHAMRRSDWDRHSGDMCFQIRAYAQSMNFHLQALRLLGYDFPIKLGWAYFRRLFADSSVHLLRLLMNPLTPYHPRTGCIARELRLLRQDMEKELLLNDSSSSRQRALRRLYDIPVDAKLNLGPDSALAKAARALLITSRITESAYWESNVEAAVVGLIAVFRLADDIGCSASKIAYETMTAVSFLKQCGDLSKIFG